MARVGTIETMENLFVMTAPYVAKAKEDERKKYRIAHKEKRYSPISEREEDYSLDKYEINEKSVSEITTEIEKTILPILKKAGINSKVFPFKPVMDKDGKIEGYEPKGKNKKEIMENIEKYKSEIEKALQENKITQDEFKTLEENLEDLMKKNDIELEEKNENMEITVDEIEANLKEFIVHNYGNETNFLETCKEYKEYDLDERKESLQEINSQINRQLGIAGDLSFSTNPNLKFENSFTKNGYMLTEHNVKSQGLKQTLYTMMEASMIREKEIKNQQSISIAQKKAMHEKIMKERERKYKEYKANQEKKLAATVRKRTMDMYRG